MSRVQAHNAESEFTLIALVMSVEAPKVVGFMTDVEGNWEYFQHCLAFSSVLQVIVTFTANWILIGV